MAKVIAIVNQKGGVGKTTTAVNLAAAVGAAGHRVLLADIDPQGNATTGLGINKKGLEASSYEVIVGSAQAAAAIVQTKFLHLWVLPASMNLAGAELELVDLPQREARLKNAFALVRDSFDFIFLDCPPALGLITINALCAADTFLLPVQCEYFALEGLSQLMNTVRQVKRLYNQTIDLEGVVLTMYDGRLNLTQSVADEVKRYFPRKVYSAVIHRNVRISEAPSFGQPVMYYDKVSRGTQAYADLASEFLANNQRFAGRTGENISK
ncbi:MAG: AAA family ATPase [Oscillospiraceae bacterium]|jgi:chromosome partitioning protein|nr:AAA family ATPase [Oscillospiraceae bacterium]